MGNNNLRIRYNQSPVQLKAQDQRDSWDATILNLAAKVSSIGQNVQIQGQVQAKHPLTVALKRNPVTGEICEVR